MTDFGNKHAAKDAELLNLSLQLAATGLGLTRENPSVGAVLANASTGQIFATARTGVGGRPHAEQKLLQDWQEQYGAVPAHATLYCALEPCYFRTGEVACFEMILQAKIKRLVVAISDPNPNMAKPRTKILAKLKTQGIAVIYAPKNFQTAATIINQGFFLRHKNNRPLIAVKIASSWDGRTALSSGHSQWITPPILRQFGQYLRCRYDALLVSADTVRQDNPSLTIRQGYEPLTRPRIILDADHILTGQEKIFQENITEEKLGANYQPIIICAGEQSNPRLPSSIQQLLSPLKNSKIKQNNKNNKNYLNWHELFKILTAKLLLNRLLIESGGEILTSLWQEKLLDEIWLCQHDILLGGDAKAIINNLYLSEIPKHANLKLQQQYDFTPSCHASYYRIITDNKK